MATPFNVVVKYITQSGKAGSIMLTASDVNAAYCLPPDGGNFFQLPSNEGKIRIIDIMATGGTDIKQLHMYQNGLNSGLILYTPLIGSSVIGRQVTATNFIPVEAGASIGLKQVT